MNDEQTIHRTHNTQGATEAMKVLGIEVYVAIVNPKHHLQNPIELPNKLLLVLTRTLKIFDVEWMACKSKND